MKCVLKMRKITTNTHSSYCYNKYLHISTLLYLNPFQSELIFVKLLPTAELFWENTNTMALKLCFIHILEKILTNIY